MSRDPVRNPPPSGVGRLKDRLDYGQVRMLDVEVFPNFFLICLDNPKVAFNTVDQFLSHLDQFGPQTLVTYNGVKFDLPLLRQVRGLEGVPNKAKDISNKLIDSTGWNEGLSLPSHVEHIDLVGVCPPFTSLKLLGARLGCQSIQDLPYEHDCVLTNEQKLEVAKYCLHDLEVTRLLFNDRKAALDLREWNQKSLSDAQIAERTLVPVKPRGEVVVPTQVTVFGKTFAITPGNGSPVDPGFSLKVINGVSYNVGLGGLHSNDEPIVIDLRAENGVMMPSVDVASYYPSMILKSHTLAPEQADIYRAIKERRLEAKRTGDKSLDDMLKIVLNGTFGKLGNRYSRLYNPQGMLSTTLMGQILLLRLIERLASPSLHTKVLSANTDGIEAILPAESYLEFRQVCAAWEAETGLTLEYEQATFVARRDVNNYFMLFPGKKKPVKTKGCFEPASVKKSPAFAIIYDAVMAHFGIDRNGETTPVSVSDYILSAAADPAQRHRFLSVRTVNGGATVDPVFEERDDWYEESSGQWKTPSGKKAKRKSRPKPYSVFLGGRKVGRVVRWYIGENGANIYTPKGGKVPLTDDAVLVQDLSAMNETLLWHPIRFQWYIDRANELLSNMTQGTPLASDFLSSE